MIKVIGALHVNVLVLISILPCNAQQRLQTSTSNATPKEIELLPLPILESHPPAIVLDEKRQHVNPLLAPWFQVHLCVPRSYNASIERDRKFGTVDFTFQQSPPLETMFDVKKIATPGAQIRLVLSTHAKSKKVQFETHRGLKDCVATSPVDVQFKKEAQKTNGINEVLEQAKVNFHAPGHFGLADAIERMIESNPTTGRTMSFTIEAKPEIRASSTAGKYFPMVGDVIRIHVDAYQPKIVTTR